MSPFPLRRPLVVAAFFLAVAAAGGAVAVEFLRREEIVRPLHLDHWSRMGTGYTTLSGSGCARPLASVGVQVVSSPDIIEEVRDGMELFRKGDVERAFEVLQEGVKKHPILPPAQVLIARLYDVAAQPSSETRAEHDAREPEYDGPETGSPATVPSAPSNAREMMREWLQRAVKEVPHDPEAYLMLGELDLQERRWTQAQLLFRKAEKLLGNFKEKEMLRRRNAMQPRVLLGLASIAEAREDWPDAEKYLEAALELDPKNADILQRLGRALFRQKDIEKLKAGYERFKQAKRTDQDVLWAEAQMALLYQAAGEHHKAWLWMKSAVQIAGKRDVPTLLVAAQWAAENGRIEEAREWSNRALAADPKSFEAVMVRGTVMLFAENYEAAENHFEKAHLMKPSSFAASNNLAIALAEQPDRHKRRQALEYAENNRKLFPKSAEAASTYGWALYQNGRPDEAERALNEALPTPPHNPDTLYYYAYVLIDNRRAEFGTRLLTAALQSKAPFVNRKKAQAMLAELKVKEEKKG